MKQITLKVLKLDLPAIDTSFRSIIQIGEVEGLPTMSPELVIIKDTELNQFLENAAEEYLTDALKRRYNPLLEHKDIEVTAVAFKKAILQEIKDV